MRKQATSVPSLRRARNASVGLESAVATFSVLAKDVNLQPILNQLNPSCNTLLHAREDGIPRSVQQRDERTVTQRRIEGLGIQSQARHQVRVVLLRCAPCIHASFAAYDLLLMFSKNKRVQQGYVVKMHELLSGR
jgi:hypothetical protein